MQDIGCYSLSAGNNRNYKSDAKNWQKSVRFWYQPLLTFTFHILMFSIWNEKFTTKIEKCKQSHLCGEILWEHMFFFYIFVLVSSLITAETFDWKQYHLER